MKRKGKKVKKYIVLSLIAIILIMTIAIFFIYYSIKTGIFTGRAISQGREYSVFKFYLNNSGKYIDGEVNFDDNFYGRTSFGNISVYSMNKTPNLIRFKGTYNRSKFDLSYSFPVDYKDFDYIPFVVFEEDLTKDNFYNSDRLHWSHMPLTYRFNNYCPNEQRIKQAFYEFNKSTNGTVYFVQTLSDISDLNIICISDQSKDSSYISQVIGESGLTNVKDNLILNSTIFFYPTVSSCGYFPLVEVHEILHSLGFSHNSRISSVMYNNTDNCRWLSEYKDIYGVPRIDDEIVKELMKTYSRS